MKHYLALIRKADFTDLFKYGRFHINNDMKTDFQCPVEELPRHPELFMAISHYANAFDNAFSYLIIHYTKETTEGLPNDLYIEDVKHIYPLDFESKNNLEFSFDERIRIEEPLWSESVLELQKHMMEQECKKGAHNIHHIIGYDNSDFRCEEFITDDIIKEIVDELYEDRRPTGNLSLWVYLLRYERHDFYPQDILGCFMDMVNIVCNRHAEREVSENDIKNTAIFNLLNSFRGSKPKFEYIYNAICTDERVKGFLSLVDQHESRIDFIKTATIFLYLRCIYPEDFKYEPKVIEPLKKYGEEFELASYLLGVILGHMHTYDCLYEKLPLAIFKEKIVVPKEPEEKPQPEQEENQPEVTEQITEEKLPEATEQIPEGKLPEATEQITGKSSQGTDETAKEPVISQDSESGIQEGIIVESRMNSRETSLGEDDTITKEDVVLPNDTVKKPSRSIPSLPFYMEKIRKDGSPYQNCRPVKITSYEMFFEYEKKDGGKWKIQRKEKTFFD